MKVRKAVFPAAGLGTCFLPATKAQPEEMLPLVDKPIVQYVVEEAVASGLDAAAEAVTRWRFDPARNGSDPVAVWVLIPVEFRLKSEF